MSLITSTLNINKKNRLVSITPNVFLKANPEFGKTSDIDNIDNELNIHINDVNNPHNVTKEQVGLGNVDNTSDINKPISNATQVALNNIKSTIINTFHYKGFKNTYNEIENIIKPAIGDVWNCIEAHDKYPAGTNYVWIGSQWSPLCGEIDLSNYQEKLIAGDGIKISEDNVISATNIIAGTVKSVNNQTPNDDGNIVLTAENIPNAYLDTQAVTDLATKQNKLIAGENITISNNIISATLNNVTHEVNQNSKIIILDGNQGDLIKFPNGETLLNAIDNILQDLKIYIYAVSEDKLNIEKYRIAFSMYKINNMLYVSDPLCESIYNIGGQIINIADVIANEQDPNSGINIKITSNKNNITIYSYVESTQLQFI